MELPNIFENEFNIVMNQYVDKFHDTPTMNGESEEEMISKMKQAIAQNVPIEEEQFPEDALI